MRVVSIALLVVACLLQTVAAAQSDRPYTQTENVVYGEVDGIGLIMDVFRPTGEANGLGIIDVTSGAWHSDRGKIEDHRRGGFYDVFCGRGYVIFEVRPGSIGRFTGEEMLQHVKRGIRFVKAHAEEYGVDPDRLGITGASAGGHLATLAVVTADAGQPDAKDPVDRPDSQVKAAAVFFPPTDFLDWDGRTFDLLKRGELFYVGGGEGHSEEELNEKARKLSPARLVSGATPPFLFIHGDADPVVPLQQSKKMIEALKAAGNSAELIVKPGGEHAWPTIREEVQAMADWFDKQLSAESAKP